MFTGAIGLAFQAKAAAVTYEVSAAVIQGGVSSGYCILLISNLNATRPYEALVRATAYEKNTGRPYQFSNQIAVVPPAERNPITNDLAKAGAKMVSFKLRDAGFGRFARVQLQINTEGEPPLFGMVVLITDNHGNVLYTADIRQFRAVP